MLYTKEYRQELSKFYRLTFKEIERTIDKIDLCDSDDLVNYDYLLEKYKNLIAISRALCQYLEDL